MELFSKYLRINLLALLLMVPAMLYANDKVAKITYKQVVNGQTINRGGNTILMADQLDRKSVV